MTIRILPAALRDLTAGYAFYEAQRAGLGEYFHDSLFADIDSLIVYAGIHRQVFGYHQMLAKRFPYAIYYSHDGEDVLVYRVLDMRRDPRGLSDALV